MIGVRYDALTERWVVLVLPTLERDPEIPIAWKQTEEEARTFGSLYAPNGLIDLNRPADGLSTPANQTADARRAVIAAIDLALLELDRPALIAVAIYASRLLPTERPPAAPEPLEPTAEESARLDTAAAELDAPDRWTVKEDA